MAKYYEDAKIIADLMRDKNRMKAQISGASDNVQIGKSGRGAVTLSTNYRMRTRTIGDSFILGHPTLAKLGTGKLGDRKGAWVHYEGFA